MSVLPRASRPERAFPETSKRARIRFHNGVLRDGNRAHYANSRVDTVGGALACWPASPYSAPMSPAHPFVLDIKRFRHRPDRFTYSIGQSGEPRVHSPHTYSTFEEARVAGKAALEAAVAKWRRRELVRHPA